MKRIATVLFVLAVVLTATVAATDKVREEKLQKAIDLIESKGDLANATPLLEDVAKSSDHALAARGLLQLAQAQERFGKGDALATYQRILNEFGGPAEAMATGAVVNAARARLEATGQKVIGPVTRQIMSDIDDGHFDAVSPDGKYMTFEAEHNDVAIRDIASGQVRLLTTKGQTTASFAGYSVPSPDSRQVAHTWWDSDRNAWELHVVPKDGGQSRIIFSTRQQYGFRLWGWHPDGKSILISVYQTQAQPRVGDLVTVPTAGGAPRVIKHLNPDLAKTFELSPDGRFIALNMTAPGGSENDIFCLSVDTGREMPIAKHAADDYLLGWLPEGDGLLFASDRKGGYGIWAAQVVNGQEVGAPRLIRADTGRIKSFGITKKGELFYSTMIGRREVKLAALDPTTGRQAGQPKTVEGRYTGGMGFAAWSPDGQKLAYVQFADPAAPLIYDAAQSKNEVTRLAIQVLSTGEVRFMSPEIRDMSNPVWLSDGRRLTVQGISPQGRRELFIVDTETGSHTLVADPQTADTGYSWPVLAPDERHVFRQFAPLPKFNGPLAVRDLTNGTERTLTSDAIYRFALSRDGQWVAVIAFARSADPHLTVIPASGGSPRPLSTLVNRWTLQDGIDWSADGRSLFVVRREPTDAEAEIWQVPVDGSEPRRTGIRFSNRLSRLSSRPDGTGLLLSSIGNALETWVLSNVPSMRESKGGAR